MLIFWLVCVVATVFIADQKKLGGVWYFLLALMTGPLALVIAVLMPDRQRPGAGNAQTPRDLEEAKKQVQQLRGMLSVQEVRIRDLEVLLARLSGEPRSIVEKEAKPVALEVVYASPVPPRPAQKADMEMDFGRNWLSKIGVAVLSLGIAFLISYTFKYFGPFLKIAFGYAVAGALFFAGTKLEAKERLMHFGRVLLGGAWAIMYFTTYAMHHFAGSRLISNELADLFLLGLVVAGMMAHVLKYKSENMTAMALFVAYLTSTIGQITGFTVISSVLLAVLVLVLVYRFQWVKTLTLGIIMTYSLHYLWIMPKLSSSLTLEDPALMNFIFLSCYWLVFGIGVHLIRSVTDPAQLRLIAGTNFGNIALYSLLSYPLVLKLFGPQKFMIVLAEGLAYVGLAVLMKMRGRRVMYVSDAVAGVLALTFALSLKFLPATSLILWIIEVPCLLLVGVNLKEKVYRYLAYALAFFVPVRILFLSGLHMPAIEFLGFHCPWHGGMCLLAAISMAVCCAVMQTMKPRPLDKEDRTFDLFSAAAFCVYVSIWVLSFVHHPWTAFSLLLLAAAFFGLDSVLNMRRFRVCAYAVLLGGMMAFLSQPVWRPLGWSEGLIVSADVLIVFGWYFAFKILRQAKIRTLIFEHEDKVLFGAGLFLLAFALDNYMYTQWISLSLGTASAAVMLMGFLGGNKTERLGGILLLALTLGRVVLVDLSGVDIVFKIITLIVLGLLFLGVSYIYNRYGQNSQK